MYDDFEGYDGIRKTDKVHLIRALTKDNIFLPQGYYESLLEDYGGPDNPLAQQELFGRFVNLQAGAIYWGFDRTKHMGTVKFQEGHTILIGQDFNIDNMCGVYVQRINGHYNVYQENSLTHRDANTEDTALKIKNDVGNRDHGVIPDSTASARKTSSGKGGASSRSDIQILESHGLNVYRTKNPAIRDRQNALNLIFKKNRITIDHSCKKLRTELETLSSRDNEGQVSHLAVALGYVVWYFDPLLRSYGKSESIAL